jgi:hypothetical protein
MSKARDLANAGTALTTVSATELGYLDGVTSAVQTQINSKIGQSTAINPSTITAKGDLIVGTGAGTFVRQGVGADGQVLTANSAQADGVEWAALPATSSITLLSTTTLSGSSTTISSINQTYTNLYIVVYGVTNATNNNSFNCRPNSATTTSWRALDDAIRTGDSDWILTGDSNHPDRTSANNAYALTIYNYAATTFFKPIQWSAYYQGPSSAQQRIFGGGGFRSNSAVTSILFRSAGGDLSTGTVLIYGVK